MFSSGWSISLTRTQQKSQCGTLQTLEPMGIKLCVRSPKHPRMFAVDWIATEANCFRHVWEFHQRILALFSERCGTKW